jgi:UDP-glucose 4-epimerase
LSRSRKVLLTGGAGYIGSHTAVEFLNAGHEIVVVDNLSNSSVKSVKRVERLTNKSIDFYQIDLLDAINFDKIFDEHEIDAVVHFAGLKAVGESVSKPLDYYRTNITTTLNLCDSMLRHGVRDLAFSSSATVYGEPKSMPIDEDSPVIDATNPYGRTKLMIEKILSDVSASEPSLNIALLRYFNPGGAHISGEIGEDPTGIPNNLLPFVSQVAVGKREELVVFGEDYPTHDGTCIRDYIHVVDLAKGHLAAIEKLADNPGLIMCNLGTGTGYSVLDIIAAFEKANNLKIPYRMGPRRDGDIPSSYTNPSYAKKMLGWEAEYGIEEICRDAWNWQSKNPNGYNDDET